MHADPRLHDELAVACGGTTARVALQGGELCAWQHEGRELLWPGDPRWWARRCPVLFPVVGRLHEDRTQVGGKSYHMPRHGFAAREAFTLVRQDPGSVTVMLESSAATRAQYPFEFQLEIDYRAQPDGIDAVLALRNTGDVQLPFAIGLHPGFHWPFDAASPQGHTIVFEHDEQPWVPVVTSDGLLAATLRRVPLQGSRLPLDASLFQADALCFLGAHSRSVRFRSPDGSAIALAAENFDHWALWSPPGAPLLSIEAWTGHADPPGFDGELAGKPSMRLLAPGESSRHRLELRYEPPGRRP